MTKLSSLISKPVISLYNCECVGIVYNTLFDKQTKSLKYLVILDEENDIEYILNTKDIFHSSHDAIIIKNSEILDLKQNLEMELSPLENVVLKPIYSVDGISHGVVKDIEINNKYKIENIITESKTIAEKNIVKIDKITLVSDRKICVARYKPKHKFVSTENYPVYIQTTSPKTPTKVSINEDMLLNRTVYRSIIDSQNKVIIKQNTLINNSTIEIAKKHGKLKELFRYSF